MFHNRRLTRLCVTRFALGSLLLPSCGDDVAATTADTDGSTTATSTTSDSADGTTSTSSSGGTTGASEGTSSGSGTESGPTGSSGGNDTGSADSGSTTGSSTHVPCPAQDLGNTVPAMVSGSTAMQDDEFTGSCGGGGAPDMAFTFTAPENDAYTFHTLGSQLDTVLYVLDGTCQGRELACNEDSKGSQSIVSVDLTAGQTVTVVVDGFAALGNTFMLSVEQGQLQCPRADLGTMVPQSYQDSNHLVTDEFELSCGSMGTGEMAYLFEAPTDGDYVFDTVGSEIDTVIGILAGTCGGEALICDDDGGPGDTGASALAVPLAQGQQVTVLVQGYGDAIGTFQLNVDQLGGACPDQDLGSAIPADFAGSMTGADNTVGGSCGGLAGVDQTFSFTAAQAGLYTVNTQGSTSNSTVLIVRDGDCFGPELACETSTFGNADTVLNLAAGQQVILAVDTLEDSAHIELHIDQGQCPTSTLDGALPIHIEATTQGEPSLLNPPCGRSDGAPEATYSFTAPSDGVYQFDTNGSTIDTIVSVFEGAQCLTAPLACDDDSGTDTGASLVARALSAGQTVTVAVDGYDATAGNYVLNVSEMICETATDLGSTFPLTYMGSTAGTGDDTTGYCDMTSGGEDQRLTWTAPATGTYRMWTENADFDALLYAFDGPTCVLGTTLGCDDDSGVGTAAELTLNLVEGQLISIVVDSFPGTSGAYTLRIAAP